MKIGLETWLSQDHLFSTTELNKTSSGKMPCEELKSYIVKTMFALKKMQRTIQGLERKVKKNTSKIDEKNLKYSLKRKEKQKQKEK